MISEYEARSTVMQLGTAMLNDDKQAREMVYAELDEDSLKRVIRWSMRQLLFHFSSIAVMQGLDPMDAWSKLAIALTMEEEGE